MSCRCLEGLGGRGCRFRLRGLVLGGQRFVSANIRELLLDLLREDELRRALAGEVDLNEEEFQESLRSRKYRAAHLSALRHAYKEVGVEGVPLFVIGDRMLSGVQDRETLESVVDEQLAKSGLGSS